MEDYLIKIYVNPFLIVRKLKFKKILFFYRYFKQELLFLNSFDFYEKINDKKFNKDKRKIKKIINVIKLEIKRRKKIFNIC